MELRRLFTSDIQSERENLWTTWTKKDIKITDSKGNSKFEMSNVEVPTDWSEVSIQIMASKYFCRGETSIKQVINRVVNKIGEWADTFNYFKDEQLQIFKDELGYIFAHQMALPNSPILFNFGIPTRKQCAAACYLLGIEDSLDSIRDWISLESKIFASGAGSGLNISPLREANAPLTDGGHSSGPISFMKAADCSAGVIKSGGKTRRSAKMIEMNVNHPDIVDFIKCKSIEEEKAKALIAAGYDPSMDGPAYSTVAFQNTNHSVRVDKSFMEKVDNNDVEANNLLNLIASEAWKTGDPGLQYQDNIDKYYTIPNSGPQTTANVCGEIISQPDYTSCTLASFNLLKFWQSANQIFDFESFNHTVTIVFIALDVIISGAEFPDKRIEINTRNQRHIGLGYCNLGALFLSAGIAYDSNEARDIAAKISAMMTGNAYLTSSYLAKQHGYFIDFPKNKIPMLNVLKLQYKEVKKLHFEGLNLVWGEVLNSVWEEVLNCFNEYGMRNANTSAIAPTGTIALAMGADTTGIEPDIGIIKYKVLAGGGNITIINPLIKTALTNLHYSNEEIETIIKHIYKYNSVIGSSVKNEHIKVFQTAFGENFLRPEAHIDMVAAVQPYISEGISKTCNVPNNATPNTIKNLYIYAWKKGLKAISIYRDGCKLAQPLTVKKSIETKEEKFVTTTTNAQRRSMPSERPSITHKASIAGFEFYITVGMYDDGTPGEVFINASKEGSVISNLLDTIGILFSYGLQYGIPLDAIVDKLKGTRSEPSGFTQNPDIRQTTSIIDYVARWLELKFIKNKQINYVNHTNNTHTSVAATITPPPIFTSLNGNANFLFPLINGNKNGNVKTTFVDMQLSHGVESSHSMTTNKSYGMICKSCGGILIQSGTCHTCLSCGDAGGCG